MWFGAACLAFMVVAAMTVGSFTMQVVALNREARQFADGSVVAIVTQWNEKALLERASPELLEEFSEEVIAKQAFASWQRLGRLVKYYGSQGAASWLATLQTGRITTAAYLGTAAFQNGIATIRINLIKRDGVWRIMQFGVYGMQLFEEPGSPNTDRSRLGAPAGNARAIVSSRAV